MKSLSVRGLPDETYEALKAMAAKRHRSLQEQVRHILEQQVRLASDSTLAAARSWRKRLAGREFADVVADIRADRER
jgi:plasmid stability protein